jgi:prevent-host-death family protein
MKTESSGGFSASSSASRARSGLEYNPIRSISDFKRNTSELLERLKKTGNPLVLTINGRPEVVVQTAEAYQELLERVETVEGLRRGLADVKAGRTKPAREMFTRLRRKHGMPR